MYNNPEKNKGKETIFLYNNLRLSLLDSLSLLTHTLPDLHSPNHTLVLGCPPVTHRRAQTTTEHGTSSTFTLRRSYIRAPLFPTPHRRHAHSRLVRHPSLATTNPPHSLRLVKFLVQINLLQ